MVAVEIPTEPRLSTWRGSDHHDKINSSFPDQTSRHPFLTRQPGDEQTNPREKITILARNIYHTLPRFKGVVAIRDSKSLFSLLTISCELRGR